MLKYLTLIFVGTVSGYLNKDPYAGEIVMENLNAIEKNHTAKLDHFDPAETRTY